MYAGRQGENIFFEVSYNGFIVKATDALFHFHLLTMYQVFTLGNVWKQLVECLVVLYETLKNRNDKSNTS